MQHLDDGLIHELIDGEIPSRDLAPIQAHLAACEACRARLETARVAAAEADELLIMLDEVEPAAPDAAPLVFPARRPHWSRNLALAASLMLAVGLGYVGRDTIDAVVGSPVESERVAAEPTPEPVEQPAMRDGVQPNAADQDAPTPEPPPAAPTIRRDAVEPARSAVEDQAAPPPTVAQAAGAAAPAEVTRQATVERLENEAAGRDSRRERAAAPVSALREPVGAGAVPMSVSRDAAKSMIAAREVDLPTAMRILGGSIKLIDGLVPHRLDAAGDEVMVVYRVFWGELLLSQRRDGDRLDWHLTGPTGFPADSLAVLRTKVRP